VLELDDVPELAVKVENAAVLDVVGRSHEGRAYAPCIALSAST
jgi:hypothetical protein